MAEADGIAAETASVGVDVRKTHREDTVVPDGTHHTLHCPPGAYAPGYIPAPLRGSDSECVMNARLASKCGMKADQDKSLREHVTNLLDGNGAHLTLENALDGLPKETRGMHPPNVPHTPWRLLEHIRIAQQDILDFCTNSKYKELKWPEDYWPKQDAPRDDEEWEKSVEAVHQDLERMKKLVNDPKVDVFGKIPWGDGQTYLREALLVADHNAYHVGEIVAVRRALGAWNAG